MLFHRKTICSHTEIILKVLWVIYCIVVIIVTIVLLSKYSQEATYLRNWTNETNDYVTIAMTVNVSLYQKFLKFLNSNSSNNFSNTNINNNMSEQTNYEVSMLDSGIGVYEPITEIPYVFSHIEEDSKHKICKPLPPKEDFSECGNSVAQRKCCEYIWAWKYKDDLIEHYSCGDYAIVGGETAEPGQFPHMVAVGFRRLNITKSQHLYSYKCGGSLISEQFVLTAAHCTHLGEDKDHEKRPEVVAMGNEYILEKMELKRISKIIPHDQYASPKRYFDIALLKLKFKVDFTYKIHPACLSTECDPQYTDVNITGWGTTNPQDETHMTDSLQVATVNIINRTTCEPMTISFRNRNFKELSNHQICAGTLDKRVDTCQGDSGGPLQVRINTPYGNIHRILGVTSFGKMCASRLPSIYTSVSAVMGWIEKNVWPQYKDDDSTNDCS